MFLLVPAYPGSPGSRAVKWLCVLNGIDVQLCFTMFYAPTHLAYYYVHVYNAGMSKYVPRKCPFPWGDLCPFLISSDAVYWRGQKH